MAHVDLNWTLIEILLGEADGGNAAGFAKDSGRQSNVDIGVAIGEYPRVVCETV